MKQLLKLLFIILLFTGGICKLYAQEESQKKIRYGISFSYGFGLRDIGTTSNSFGYDNRFGKMYVGDIRALVGYPVSSQLSMGLGLGLAGYHNNTFNTLPVLLDIRYDFNKKVFAYSDMGIPLGMNDGIKSGLLTDWGIGFKFHALRPSIGYNFITYRIPWVDNVYERRFRHSLYLRLGVEF